MQELVEHSEVSLSQHSEPDIQRISLADRLLLRVGVMASSWPMSNAQGSRRIS